MDVDKYTLPIGDRTVIMGILNVTPDSFTDGGKYNQLDRAIARAIQLVEDGADILDIGGESTRPGSSAVSVEEECERVLPVIEKLASEVDVPLSIDTYKAGVAEEAIGAGAHIINDVWGAKRDPAMATVAARHGVPIILMHNGEDRDYVSFVDDVVDDLCESIQIVEREGVLRENIILDPGIGFAKSAEKDVWMLKNITSIIELGYPVLLGTSRKSFIGTLLDIPVEQRLEATLATIGYGIMRGCHIVRVHDVKQVVDFSRMMDAILDAEEG